MNNEEKKAMYRLKKDAEKPLSCGDITIVIIDDINAVLNLIEKQQKEIEDKKEEIYSIAKTNYDVGMLEERSQWYKKINEKYKELTQEEKDTDGIVMNTNEKKILKELIGKEE